MGTHGTHGEGFVNAQIIDEGFLTGQTPVGNDGAFLCLHEG